MGVVPEFPDPGHNRPFSFVGCVEFGHGTVEETEFINEVFHGGPVAVVQFDQGFNGGFFVRSPGVIAFGQGVADVVAGISGFELVFGIIVSQWYHQGALIAAAKGGYDGFLVGRAEGHGRGGGGLAQGHGGHELRGSLRQALIGNFIGGCFYRGGTRRVWWKVLAP